MMYLFTRYVIKEILSLPQNKLSHLCIYRSLRSERLKKLFRDSDKLTKVLSEFAQSQNKAEETETCNAEISNKKEDVVQSAQRESNNIKELIEPEVNVIKDLEHSKPEVISDIITITAENQFDELAKVVTPLYELPYNIQLKRKFTDNLNFLRALGPKLKEAGYKIPEGSNNQPCVLDDIIPSPVIYKYRNKDEFSIRTGVDGNPKTVGFFLQKTSKNSETLCVRPDKLLIIKDSHKLVAKEFENYIRQSPLPACHNFFDAGYWRNIIVRSNNQGDIMAVVIFHPQNLTKEEIEEEKNKLKQYFLKKKEELNIKSFYFQTCSHTRCTHAQSPFQLLFGESYIFEELNNLKYRISPEAFFQINTAAASSLYQLISKNCKASKKSTILDVCCGSGSISLNMAKHVKNCIGIDTSIEAIEDARANAEMNGINNVVFHAGRSEHLIRDILDDIYAEELIAVVNPARGPLNHTIISAFRECRHLKKILFVSCKPENAVSNFVHLCRSGKKGYSGIPFHIIRAAPIDLFPHTLHSELVILFKRLS